LLGVKEKQRLSPCDVEVDEEHLKVHKVLNRNRDDDDDNTNETEEINMIKELGKAEKLKGN
jgi:hypothetical protein